MNDGVKTTLMTGSSGFLGHFVLRDLLRRGRRVVALLRPPLGRTTRQLESLLKQLDFELKPFINSDQLLIIKGTLPDDLPSQSWGHTDDILSCAASLQLFSNGNQEPFKTNVAGTDALLEWARRYDVRNIFAVSTAYVCGSYLEAVKEVFHHPCPEFLTEYERSKWMAETRLVDWAGESGNTLTVLRPSVLVGDSTTGYTTQFGGFYQFARLMSILRNQYADQNGSGRVHVPLRLPGRPHDPHNFVPVDYAAQIIGEVVCNPHRHGRIYHLTDPQPPTNEQIKQWLEDYFQISGGYFVESDQSHREPVLDEPQLGEDAEVLIKRIAHNPRFDQENTRALMREVGMSFPILTRKRFFSLLDYAVRQRWGQRATRVE